AVQEEDGRPRVSRGAPGPQRGGGTTRGAGRAWALVPWHVSPLLGGPGSPVGPVLGWAPFSWMCPVVPDAVRWPPDRVRQGLVRPVPLCRGAARGGGLRITRVYGCRVPPSGPVAARGPGRVVRPGRRSAGRATGGSRRRGRRGRRRAAGLRWRCGTAGCCGARRGRRRRVPTGRGGAGTRRPRGRGRRGGRRAGVPGTGRPQGSGSRRRRGRGRCPRGAR